MSLISTAGRHLVAPMVLSACLLLGACHGSAAGGPSVAAGVADRLEALLVDLPPSEYPPGPAAASGPLDRTLAAQATVVPPGRMSGYLAAHGFVGGYSRVWNVAGAPDAYVTAFVFGFGAPAQAQGLVAAAVASLRDALGTYVTPLAGVPGGQAYGLSGQQRVGGHYLFCAGAWFAVGPNTFTVTWCSTAQPVPVTAVEPLALQQYGQVSGPEGTHLGTN